jgi:hypothetical protein
VLNGSGLEVIAMQFERWQLCRMDGGRFPVLMIALFAFGI